MNKITWILLFLFSAAIVLYSESHQTLIIYGEYPVVMDLGEGIFERRNVETESFLIEYENGDGYKEKAFIEALHFINANVFGYSFIYRPGSILMKTEETFDIELRGRIEKLEAMLMIPRDPNLNLSREEIEEIAQSRKRIFKALREKGYATDIKERQKTTRSQ